MTVFEGFMDFLSALTFDSVAQPKTDVIVLNSVSLKERALMQIQTHIFTTVYLYLDRDEAGNRLKDFFFRRMNLP